MYCNSNRNCNNNISGVTRGGVHDISIINILNSFHTLVDFVGKQSRMLSVTAEILSHI